MKECEGRLFDAAIRTRCFQIAKDLAVAWLRLAEGRDISIIFCNVELLVNLDFQLGFELQDCHIVALLSEKERLESS